MSFWKNKQVFMTGATGFIGSWLTLRLIEKGARVFFLDNRENRRSILNEQYPSDRIEKLEGCLTDKKSLFRILQKTSFDFIYHLGAQTQVTQALEDPVSTYEINALGTAYLMEACRLYQQNAHGIIVASSDKAYGSQEECVFDEISPLRPLYPYDVSKACTEMIALSYYHTYKLPIVVTRSANVYGGGDFNNLRLIPYVVLCSLQGETPILRSDGTLIREYIYIEDVIEGYLKIGQLLQAKSLQGEVFNFGGNDPKTVLSIVNLIYDLMKKKPPHCFLGQPYIKEIHHQVLSSKKANQKLEWEAKFPLKLGLQATIDWYSHDLKKSLQPYV